MRFASQGDLLASGWAIGADRLQGRAAAIEAKVGKGKVFLFGTDVTYRGQPQTTIRMFLNAVLFGGAPPVTSSEMK